MNVRVNLLAIFVLSICSTCAHAQFDTVINLPENPDSPNPSGFSGNSIGGKIGISSNTQLNVSDGGLIGPLFDAGAEDVTSTDIEVNISGGKVALLFDANSGSTVNISGGTILPGFNANSGSTVNISGGTVDSGFDANSGSTVNISGGDAGAFFMANDGSEVNISGGTVGNFFNADSGSTVNISGGEFLLNGSTISDITSPFTLGDGDVFTGTLEDGSSFIFSSFISDRLNGVNLIETSTPILSATPQIINTASTLRSLGTGQTLTVQLGGALGDNFTAVGATLNVESGSVGSFAEVANSEANVSGGTVGNNFDAFSGSTINVSGGQIGGFFEAFDGSTVNISGGTVGNVFNANSGSTVNISGGTVDNLFNANSGSTVNISGGTVGENFDAFGGSTVNISGGTVGENFDALIGSTVNISGGTFENFDALLGSTVNISGGEVGIDFDAFSGSTVNLFGTEFFLNGSLVDASTLGEPFTIFDRGEDVVLSGVFADGTLFDFDLNPNNTLFSSLDFFDSDSTLTITLVPVAVPEPGCGLTLATMSLVLLVRRRRALR